MALTVLLLSPADSFPLITFVCFSCSLRQNIKIGGWTSTGYPHQIFETLFAPKGAAWQKSCCPKVARLPLPLQRLDYRTLQESGPAFFTLKLFFDNSVGSSNRRR